MAFQKSTSRQKSESEDRRLLGKILARRGLKALTATETMRIESLERYIEELEQIRDEIGDRYGEDASLALNRLDVRIGHVVRLLARERVNQLDGSK